jgi:hypothetical protein
MIAVGTKVLSSGQEMEVVQKVAGTRTSYLLKIELKRKSRGSHYLVRKERDLVIVGSPEGERWKEIEHQIDDLREQLEKLYEEERALTNKIQMLRTCPQ